MIVSGIISTLIFKPADAQFILTVKQIFEPEFKNGFNTSWYKTSTLELLKQS